jgi:hypothetical protein
VFNAEPPLIEFSSKEQTDVFAQMDIIKIRTITVALAAPDVPNVPVQLIVPLALP